MEQFQCSLTIHLGTSAESGILREETQNPSLRVCLRQIVIFRQDAAKPLLKTGRVRRVRVSLLRDLTLIPARNHVYSRMKPKIRVCDRCSSVANHFRGFLKTEIMVALLFVEMFHRVSQGDTRHRRGMFVQELQ